MIDGTCKRLLGRFSIEFSVTLIASLFVLGQILPFRVFLPETVKPVIVVVLADVLSI